MYLVIVDSGSLHFEKNQQNLPIIWGKINVQKLALTWFHKYATQNVRPRTEKSNCGLDDP